MKKTHKLSLAIALALVAGNASALVTSDGTSAAGVNSSILLTVTDTNTSNVDNGNTYFIDLALGTGNAGLNYSNFVTTAKNDGGSLSWNLSSYLPAALASDVSNLEWSVVGANAQHNGGGALLTYNGNISNPNNLDISSTGADLLSFTGTTASALIHEANLGIAAENAGSNIGVLPTGASETVYAQYANPGNLLSDNDSGYTTVGGLGVTPISNSATGASSIAVLSVTNPNPNIDASTVAQVGTFALNANDTLTFTTGPVSAVPLPAASWFFVSGLLGLLGANRRKRTAV